MNKAEAVNRIIERENMKNRMRGALQEILTAEQHSLNVSLDFQKKLEKLETDLVDLLFEVDNL